MNSSPPAYFRHRFPAEIFSHCARLYFRFCLKFRDIEEMMARRGGLLSYEIVRGWSSKFGEAYDKRMRSRNSRAGDRWHLDEVFLRISGKLQYLWRAVDQAGEVLDILVRPRRNKRAAYRFFRKLLKALRYVPRAIITDQLRSYAVANIELLPSVKQRRNRWLNNWAEDSPDPTRERGRRMRGFKSPGHAPLTVGLRSHRVIFPTWVTSTGCGELPRDHVSPLHAVA